MKDQPERTVQTVQDAARRLEEIRQLSDDLKDVLRARITQMRDERDLSPTEITKKLGELHSAHLKLIQQEEIFYQKCWAHKIAIHAVLAPQHSNSNFFTRNKQTFILLVMMTV